MARTASFARINLDQSRKQAKDLVKAFKAGDQKALDTIFWNHPRFRSRPIEETGSGTFALADAQLVIARLHHFASWRHLLDYVATLDAADPTVARFENAADAIVAGDAGTLRAMLRDHPELIHQRSSRAHRSTLLHYVSANGVEDYRQVTPDNILDLTALLLDAGADVNATSDAYGGGSTTLGLVSTSAHPRAKHVQIPLIDLLLERGARIDGEGDLHDLVRGALANGCPEAADALAARGARVETLFAAAGVGDLHRVELLYPQSSPRQREAALIVAAQRGNMAVITYLLDQRVDVSASDGMTALHQASAGGHLDVMDLLIARGASLEKLNTYGGTVLSSTIWFAYHVDEAEFRQRNYPRVFERLIAAGARTDFYPDLLEDIEVVNRRAKSL